ncbi:hypothetical protein J4217_00055 [Candidatus Pacearchaeota archaeon]|nr:hypothetical protein [Candidatus Pacearchaeota archaeon]
MKLPKDFDYYLKSRIIRKITPDTERAKFLEEESARAKKALDNRLKRENVDDLNANSIVKECYDILMSLIRAKLLNKGYYSSGSFAHEAELSFLIELNFSENDIGFMNELRYLRNGVIYYGKILDKEYCEKVLEFLDRTYKELIKGRR